MMASREPGEALLVDSIIECFIRDMDHLLLTPTGPRCAVAVCCTFDARIANGGWESEWRYRINWHRAAGNHECSGTELLPPEA
jgi:hypothetical protein